MDGLQQQFEHALLECKSTKDIEALKLRYLGKKGLIQEQMRQLREVPAEDRPAVGAKVNAVKVYIEEKLDQFLSRIVDQEREQQMADEHQDVTLPGRRTLLGSKHPITATRKVGPNSPGNRPAMVRPHFSARSWRAPPGRSYW